MEDPLNKVFDLEIKTSEVDVIPAASSENNNGVSTLNQDLEFIKTKQKDIIEKASSVLETAIEVAVLSQEPRAMVAVAEVIKALNSATDTLAKISFREKDQEIKEKAISLKKTITAGTINNNAIFVGSTSELQRFLKDGKFLGNEIVIEKEENEK